MAAGLHTPGCLQTLLTMAPGCSGSLSGFVYFFISLTSIASPLLIGKVVMEQTAQEWAIVFRTTAFLAFTPLLFFNIWGSAEEQSWSREMTSVQGDKTSTPATVCQIAKDNLKSDQIIS